MNYNQKTKIDVVNSTSVGSVAWLYLIKCTWNHAIHFSPVSCRDNFHPR